MSSVLNEGMLAQSVVPIDAMSQLQAEHRHIRRLFNRIGRHHQQTHDLTFLLQAICDRLTIYLVLKEDVFYPAMLALANNKLRAQLNESLVEHYSLRVIMGTLDGQSPGDPLFSAKVKSLKQHFVRHADYAEDILFPDLKALTSMDFNQRLYDRRQELVANMRDRRFTDFDWKT